MNRYVNIFFNDRYGSLAWCYSPYSMKDIYELTSKIKNPKTRFILAIF